MPIPLPALDIRPPAPNQLMNDYGQMVKLRDLSFAQANEQQQAQQESQLNDQRLQEGSDKQAAYQRAIDQTNAVNAAYQHAYKNGHVDANDFQSNLAGAGFGSAAPAALDSIYKAEKAQKDIQGAVDKHNAASANLMQGLVRVLHKSGHDPLMANWALNTLSNQHYTQLAQQYGQMFKQNPTQFWNTVDSMALSNPAVANSQTQAENAATEQSRATETARHNRAAEASAQRRDTTEAARLSLEKSKASQGGGKGQATKADFLRVEEDKHKAYAALEKDAKTGTLADSDIAARKAEIESDYRQNIRALGGTTGAAPRPVATQQQPAIRPGEIRYHGGAPYKFNGSVWTRVQ
ncbi:MAG: hypothetical protein ACRD3D_01015 [Terriglobia bacterium]